MSFVAEKHPLFHGDIIKLIDQTVTHRFGEFAEKLPHEVQWLTDQGPQYKALQTVAYGACKISSDRSHPISIDGSHLISNHRSQSIS